MSTNGNDSAGANGDDLPVDRGESKSNDATTIIESLNNLGSCNMEVDGSILEGGGQMIRTSLSLSIALGIRLKLVNIRGKRKPPGLGNQHTAGVKLSRQLSGGGTMIGDSFGSRELEYIPVDVNEMSELKTEYLCDAVTAGSITLMQQIAMPILLLHNNRRNSVTEEISKKQKHNENKAIKLTFLGGTNVNMSPPIDHYSLVLFPLLRRMGINVYLGEVKRGYYPQGRGRVSMSVEITPKFINDVRFQPLNLIEQGTIVEIVGEVFGDCHSDIKSKLKNDMLHAIQLQLSSLGTVTESIPVTINDAVERQTTNKVINVGIQLVIRTSSDCLLQVNHLWTFKKTEPIIPMTSVVSVASKLFNLHKCGACIDENTADQMIIYMAFAKGSSMLVEPVSADSTQHLSAVIFLVEKFTGAKFSIAEDSRGCRLVTCVRSHG